MYWRLLGDPDTARQVVLAQKPVIADTGGSMEPSLLATLLANLSSLASVYHKPPEVGFLGPTPPVLASFGPCSMEASLVGG